jgi:hypothetical protein
MLLADEELSAPVAHLSVRERITIVQFEQLEVDFLAS